MDEGDLLTQADYDLHPEITAPLLTHDRLEATLLCVKFCPRLSPAASITPTRRHNCADSRRQLHIHENSAKVTAFWTSKPAFELERESSAQLPDSPQPHQINGTRRDCDELHVAESDPGSLWLDGKQLGIHCASGNFSY